MPIFTRTFQIIAGVLSVPVVGLSIIGSAYQSPFLTHLADIVEGTITSTVESTNAPNWAIGTPLAQVQNIAATVSSSGTLGIGASYSFQVAAIDVNGGTTTLGSSVTATTNAGNQSLMVSWSADPGAAAYAVFFGTSSPATLTQYFYATTSTQYVFATSTGSLTGSYTKADTTAFSTLTNPIGPSFIETEPGTTSTATSTPMASTTVEQFNGNISAQTNGTTTNCYSATAGTIFYNTQNSHEWGCNGTAWQKIF